MGSKPNCDFVVIGGGINGVSVARELAIRGQDVLLIEKSDIGAGTSSQSSKLIHGGLRYIEQFRFSLVRESLKERGLLLKYASDFVWELPLLFPVYRHSKRPMWQIALGLKIYDFLAGKQKIKPHKRFSKAEMLTLEPGLNPNGLMGGFLYYDAMTDDLKLCRAVAREAEDFGAKILDHHQVISILPEGNRVRVSFLKHSGGEKSILAKHVINCTGPWVDVFHKEVGMDIPHLIQPSKGVHIVVKRCHYSTALVATHPADGRIYFVLPWYDQTSLIGTTETPYWGHPDDVSATHGDIDYLIQAVNQTFPALQLSEENVISTFSGVRPLAKSARSVGSASREVQIQSHFSGYWTVVGGKYTTFRAIGEQVAKRVLEPSVFNRASSAHLPIIAK